jgi:GNAT superfamily N-acetyltransferase
MDHPSTTADSTGWRQATFADVDAICVIEREVHPLLQERPEVHGEKIRLFAEGCCVLVDGASVLGYAAAYPWRLDDIPLMDTLFGTLPAATDCMFIHDVALLPVARGRGYGRPFVERIAGLALGRNLTRLALVSVYGTVPVWRTLGFEIETAVPRAKFKAYGETARYMRRDLN